MIRNLKYISVALAILFLLSCKKVIDVNIKNAPSELVITGEVNNQAGPYIVSISKSVSYASENSFPPVSGAVVMITGNGITDSLMEISPGNYATRFLVGTPGKEYSLNVTVGGQTFMASSTMPQPVPLDSIGLSVGRNDHIINAVVYFQDPPGIANYYQFIEYNDRRPIANGRGNFVFDDRLSDGRYIIHNLGNDSSNFKMGDTVSIKMKCLDQYVYAYWNQFAQVSGNNRGGFSTPTPANPVSNISGGVLGYFSANTTQTKSIVLY